MNQINKELSINELVGRASVRMDSDLNPGAPIEKINSFQINHNVQLPPSFREFLAKVNGGDLHQNLHIYGIDTGDESDQGRMTLDVFRRKQSAETMRLLPFASIGIMYAFDLTNPQPNGEYPIVMWNDTSKIEKQTPYNRFDTWLKDVIDQDS